jgi:hypothetical protein
MPTRVSAQPVATSHGLVVVNLGDPGEQQWARVVDAAAANTGMVV